MRISIGSKSIQYNAVQKKKRVQNTIKMIKQKYKRMRWSYTLLPNTSCTHKEATIPYQPTGPKRMKQRNGIKYTWRKTINKSLPSQEWFNLSDLLLEIIE